MTPKQEGNQYDKIVKENIDSIIPALMDSVLGFKVAESVVIREKLQQTKEKEADALRLITDPNGKEFILHLEFQVDDYPKMIYRMADYWILLKSKYNVPVYQYVIFIGEGESKMIDVVEENGNRFHFVKINITQYDYRKFLYSDNPEEIILAVLSNFGEEKPENALNQILQRLEETKSDNTTFQKYLRQLRVFSKLRKLDIKFDDMIQNMAKYIDAENDYLYIKGQKEAKEKEQTKFVHFLLQENKYTFDQISDIAGVSVEFVKNTKQNLSPKK
jgi:hypothetical protein